MQTRHLVAGASLIALGLSPALAQESEPALQDVIIVTGSAPMSETLSVLRPENLPLEGADATYITARTPGGARIANGEISGQMAYRGLFGERLNLRVDGQRFASGGPNLMDPVFHYAPAPLIASVVVDRGVSPVSEGPGLAGGADAVLKRVDFASGEAVDFGYDLTLGGRSVNESVELGGVVGVATADWRLNLLGAWEEGSDGEYKNGVIGGTSFERGVSGLSAGVRVGQGELGVDLRRQNTGPSGNPPFPMDIIYFDTDFARASYKTPIGAAELEAAVFYTDVSHLMDNFSQRPAPAPMAQRATFAYATTRGAEISLGLDWMGGELLIGLDGEEVDHDVTITNPNNADFFVTAFPGITASRFGGFAEWTGSLGPVEGEIGVRVDENRFEAGEAELGTALPMGPRNLSAAFNTAEREGEDTTFDAVARLWTPEQDGLSWRLTLAHKQKMPGFIQRYGWLPTNASGGLADGNIYIGDLTLSPETAWIAEAGFDWRSEKAYARPTVYVREVDDYIQGVPFDDTPGMVDSPVEMIASMNGDPTPLIWANVDARLFGFDMDAGYDLDGPLRVDAVLSYVRGERRDIKDNLYRISPPSLTAGLSWEGADWSATFETRAVAEQDEVSVTNSELATPGYVVLNLHGDWQLRDGVRLSAGVENLLDQVYRDHLSGYNRNGFGDVALGRRLPGAGRGVFVRLSVAG